MKIYFLSGQFFDTEIDAIQINSKKNMQYAAHVLQNNYLHGFTSLDFISSVEVINLPYIGAYPFKYKKLKYIPVKKNIKYGKTNIYNISFINLTVLKHISRFTQSLFKSHQLLSIEKNNTCYFFIYAMHLPFLLTAFILSKKFKNIKFYVIVPDLPEYMSQKTSLFSKMKKYHNKVSYNIVNKLDGVVVITEQMANKFSSSLDKVIIEGISSSSSFEDEVLTDKNRFLLYTGTLNTRYGVLDLIEAFIKMNDPKLSLVICGEGPASDAVSRAADKHPNIRYLGLIKREQVLKLQQKASLLINPRKNEGEYTKYSFPSKILEYMSSGTPVLMYKLDGIPNEYYEYTYIIDDSLNDGLTDALKQISKIKPSELEEKGRLARLFVTKNKNAEAQTRKIFKRNS